MTMSIDKVRFCLPTRYHGIEGMAGVMRRAFKIDLSEFRDRGGTGDPFWIVCRPSQFARFLVYRAEVLATYNSGSRNSNIPNCFKDLQATLFTPERVHKDLEVWNR